MLRIIDGIVYQVRKSESRVRVTARQLGEHREVSVSAPIEMVELDAPEPILQYWRERLARPRTNAEQRDADERNRERVRRRRVTEIRRRVKVHGSDLLLTVTYKANVQDLGVAWKHWKEFVRRVRRVLPGFSYVVAWEQQKRGAWHAHAAVRRISQYLMVGGVRVKSFNVLRAVWRSVVGDLGGNTDLAKGKRSRAKIASYMAKYLGKSMASAGDGVNLWASSATKIDAPCTLEFNRECLQEACMFACDWVHESGYEFSSGWVAPWGDTMYFASELRGV
jgi:hypothetical protein